MIQSASFRRTHLILGLAATLSIGTLYSCSESNTTQTSEASRKGDTTARALKMAETGLTLPVLDALFYEEGFEDELKTGIGLTKAQIDKLRTISRAAVSDLSEDGNDYAGSARSAVKRSDEQIRKALGDEKAVQLYQMVSRRYSSGEVEGLMPTTPNAVPKDTRIVINAPAYRMDIFEEGRLLKTYKVGIGYPEFPLPTGMRRAETIIFNPTWTPPNEPWVKGKFQPGEAVEAGSKDNPLGPIKIPIGSPSLIHGGKAVAKLGTFASHGCVGLTNGQVQDFALMLSQISGSSVTGEDVARHEKQRSETKHVKLAKDVPVELRYETIVAEPGALRVYRDVYERGTNTVAAADAVLRVYGLSFSSLPQPEQQALLQALSEMNRDAQGNAIVEDIGGGAADSSGAGKKADQSLSKRAEQGKKTTTIKGRKEVLVPIAALAGKGYPAPANFDTGGGPAGNETALAAAPNR